MGDSQYSFSLTTFRGDGEIRGIQIIVLHQVDRRRATTGSIHVELKEVPLHQFAHEMELLNHCKKVTIKRDLERPVKLDLQTSHNELATLEQQKSDDKMLKLVDDQKVHLILLFKS
uniref:Uncharacterized protein n=1 Tax=Lactuca sativa TaxID=4236 RepID=A0A9R1UCI1_LACSA|nr:hypothetical protein LSAT_V11C900490530 [Lactuca sativa]